MNNLTYKNILSSLEVKQVTDDFVYIEGYASTFGNLDRDGDIIAKGAFTNTLTKRKPEFIYQHQMDKPIGVWDSLVELEEGLFVKGRMPRANSLVRDIESLAKMGALKSLSVGFNVVVADTAPDGVRVIKEIDLWEISIVTIPANPEARITGVKSMMPYQNLPLAERSQAWDSVAAVKRVRSFTKSEDEPSAAYKEAFLWHDSEDSKNFTAYKLPIADVIDGKLQIVPRAIFAAVPVLRGTRGGADIPTLEKQAIIANVEKYYKKIGMESPFEKSDNSIIGLDEVELIQTKKEFEQLLMDTGLFTRRACVTLAAKFNECQSDSGAVGQSDSVSEEALLKAIEKLKKSLTTQR